MEFLFVNLYSKPKMAYFVKKKFIAKSSKLSRTLLCVFENSKFCIFVHFCKPRSKMPFFDPKTFLFDQNQLNFANFADLLTVSAWTPEDANYLVSSTDIPFGQIPTSLMFWVRSRNNFGTGQRTMPCTIPLTKKLPCA